MKIFMISDGIAGLSSYAWLTMTIKPTAVHIGSANPDHKVIVPCPPPMNIDQIQKSIGESIH